LQPWRLHERRWLEHERWRFQHQRWLNQRERRFNGRSEGLNPDLQRKNLERPGTIFGLRMLARAKPK
jgi:hypothetical protein